MLQPPKSVYFHTLFDMGKIALRNISLHICLILMLAPSHIWTNSFKFYNSVGRIYTAVAY